MTSKNVLDFIKRHIITLLFMLFVFLGLLITDQPSADIITKTITTFIQYGFIVLALLIPIMVGMGFNFSIIVGVIAGNIAIIMAVNWGFSGPIGIIFTVLVATCFSAIFGFITGFILDKAHGHEMITSLFLGYLSNGIYQFVLLFLVGAVIPMATSELVLSSGVGLKNTIDLSSTLTHTFDNMLQVPLSLILLLVALSYLVLNVYAIIKDKPGLKKTQSISIITVSTIIIISSTFITFVDILPYQYMYLKTIDIPVITALIIMGGGFLMIRLPHTSFGQKCLAVASTGNSNTENISSSRIRIIAIILSTILGSWGHIIYTQNMGILITYGSSQTTNMAILCLIVGGASLKKATVKQAFIGVILTQAFLYVSLPLLDGAFNNGLSNVVRMIIFNSVFVYAFISKKNQALN